MKLIKRIKIEHKYPETMEWIDVNEEMPKCYPPDNESEDLVLLLQSKNKKFFKVYVGYLSKDPDGGYTWHIVHTPTDRFWDKWDVAYWMPPKLPGNASWNPGEKE